MNSIFTKPLIFAMVCVSLSGCGGGSDDTSNNTTEAPIIISNKVVTPAETPIKRDGMEMAGVSANLTNDVTVYAISEKDQSNDIKIISDPTATDGDKSELLGKTFLRFDGLKGANDTAVISGGKIKAVYECDKIKSQCKVLPVNWADGSLSFDVKSDKFYGIEKE